MSAQLRFRTRPVLRLLLGLCLTAGVFAAAPSARAIGEPAVLTEQELGRFRQVGQIDLTDSPGVDASLDNSGWLILNPVSRRGYTILESNNRTIIQSFDLDTLQPRSRAVTPGIPIVSGWGVPVGGSATYAGDIVHAVDTVAKRIYLPIAMGAGLKTGDSLTGPDHQRMVSHFLILDEERFDTDPDSAFGSFRFPSDQQKLVGYPLMGMAVTREHVKPNETGKLLAIFASVYPLTTVPVLQSTPPGTYDHTLVQWDPANTIGGPIPTDGRAPDNFVQEVVNNRFNPTGINPNSVLPVVGEWEQVLTACATASLSSPPANDALPATTMNYQWGILPTADAVYLGCQAAPMSGAVARVPVRSGDGMADNNGSQQLVALGKPISDVLVDEGGRRLYLRSFGGGSTWWAFQADEMRFAGSIAGGHIDGIAQAAGFDTATGRMYTLSGDNCIPRPGGGGTPIRGGIKMAEARLDPVPAPENIRPDLAYPSMWRIQSDPVTRRVYVRRGVPADNHSLIYPECDSTKKVVLPTEHFYRVFDDRIPLAVQPGELDDAPFTTNVPESKGSTQASFLGSGSGFGSRVVLTGGLAAATNGAFDVGESGDTRRSPCSRVDREFVLGSVGTAEVSDQSTTAEAASLDADSRTQEDLTDPVSRCRQRATGDLLPECIDGTDELAFDERGTRPRTEDDEKAGGCSPRTGDNKYAALCVDDQDLRTADGPKSNRVVPRDGFRATVKCEAAKEKVEAKAEGALGSGQFDALLDAMKEVAGTPAEPLRVGRSESHVNVKRMLGEGLTVSVDSIARAIEIPGVGTIGAVRAEARSVATGRDGRAGGTYKRAVCDIHIGDVQRGGCIVDEDGLAELARQLNRALVGRGEVRFRQPDASLIEGTPHGYLASVQRSRKELFGDQSINRDRSLAIPGLEIVLYVGEGGAWGAGRQIIQLAGVQAATSYGIACLYGQAANGKCATDSNPDLDDGGFFEDGGTGGAIELPELGQDPDPTRPGSKDPAIIRFLKKIPAAIAQAMRLLFNNPRELALLAAVWALLFAPCYLGERRSSIQALQDRRAAIGGVR